ALVPELVLALAHHLERALLRGGALGRYDDREVASARVPPANEPAYLLDVERAFGDEDHIRAAGEPRVQRDPARVPAHYLHDHDPVVALGGGVQAVDRLRGHLQRGV